MAPAIYLNGLKALLNIRIFNSKFRRKNNMFKS